MEIQEEGKEGVKRVKDKKLKNREIVGGSVFGAYEETNFGR